MPSDSAESSTPSNGRFAALGYRDFRLFWSGLLISNIGTWMQMTATNWLLYQLTNSAVLLGLNGIFRAVPALGLGVMVMEAAAAGFGLNHTMLTIFASDILRVGAHGFGLLQSARGLGAVIGSSF